MSSSSQPCVFCGIIAGSVASSAVYRDERCIAFLDLHAVNPGHTLVCTVRHVESFTGLASEETADLLGVAQRIARAQKERMPGCAGVTLALADGVVAGQEVPHAHLHVIPRMAGDGFGWKRVGERCERAELDRIAALLRL